MSERPVGRESERDPSGPADGQERDATPPTAVVTGANSGIGRATAIHLAARGYDVYGTVRDPGRATKLAAMSDERGVEVRLVELDVGDDESVRRGFEEILGATRGGG